MTSRNARRVLAALTIATTTGVGRLASQASAQSAPLNLAYAMPNTGAYFTLANADGLAYSTVSLPAGYLGSFGTSGLILNDSDNVTSSIVVTTSGLPAGLTVSLSSASILWDASGQNLTVVLEVDGSAAPGMSYDGTVTLTNTGSKQQVTMPLRVNVEAPISNAS